MVKFNFKVLESRLLALLRRSHPTPHHRAVWTRFETYLDARCFTAVPLICFFGLVRLFLFNEGTGFSSESGVIVGLNCALLIHRIIWIPLLTLGLKYPKLCRFYHCYEMLAMLLDSVLALSDSSTPAAQNFTLLYMLLMNVLVFSAFCYDFWINFFAIILHAVVVGISCHYLHDTENWPPAYQQVAVLVV